MRKTLWLFIAPLSNPDLCYALPTAAWIARDLGADIECYLECERQGDLFAKTGSTVIGGHHHQQFNYLHAIYDVKLLIFGGSSVFASSCALFGDEVLIESDNLPDFYAKLISLGGKPECAVIFPREWKVQIDEQKSEFNEWLHNAPKPSSETLDIAPYMHSEVAFSRALAYPDDADLGAQSLPVRELAKDWKSLDDYGSLTLRIAEKYISRAGGVAFGDPDAIRSQIPLLIRENRVSVYAPMRTRPIREVKLAAYTENASLIASETAELALKTGNPILVGRQTCDADLFEWGSRGVGIKIMDPNRPAFPIVSSVKHKWTRVPGAIYDSEPDDATLEKWAREGRVLSSLIFHSGEMAHNEAMLQLIDICSVTGLKLGLGAHLARYETCPQMWELLQIPRERGGVRGLVEPILHSGGLGIMAEVNCPPEALTAHCKKALAEISEIAGAENAPRGYYFFCDTDLDTHQTLSPRLYKAVESAGLEYAVSSAKPGKNKLLYDGIPVLTQTSRTLCQGSPFVRITSVEDVYQSGFASAPGWFIGVLDSPVIAFQPYIWREGTRFMNLVSAIKDGRMINVLPDTIARYARILKKMGILA